MIRSAHSHGKLRHCIALVQLCIMKLCSCVCSSFNKTYLPVVCNSLYMFTSGKLSLLIGRAARLGSAYCLLTYVNCCKQPASNVCLRLQIRKHKCNCNLYPNHFALYTESSNGNSEASAWTACAFLSAIAGGISEKTRMHKSLVSICNVIL